MGGQLRAFVLVDARKGRGGRASGATLAPRRPRLLCPAYCRGVERAGLLRARLPGCARSCLSAACAAGGPLWGHLPAAGSRQPASALQLSLSPTPSSCADHRARHPPTFQPAAGAKKDFMRGPARDMMYGQNASATDDEKAQARPGLWLQAPRWGLRGCGAGRARALCCRRRRLSRLERARRAPASTARARGRRCTQSQAPTPAPPPRRHPQGLEAQRGLTRTLGALMKRRTKALIAAQVGGAVAWLGPVRRALQALGAALV